MHSFVYLVASDSIQLVDLAVPSWVSDAESFAVRIGVRFLDVEHLAIEPECHGLIPLGLARSMDILVIEATQTAITVGSPCPDRFDRFESLRFSVGRSVVSCLASRDAIHRVLSLRPHESGDPAHDPQEDDPSIRPLIRRAFREAKQETDQYWLGLGDPIDRNYDAYLSHLYRRQKRHLAHECGITWCSPLELNANHVNVFFAGG
ncbi:MAG TPA: hypothetical protein VMM76_10780 [Pirellulaceae bacterium]|nr:hypothetical protein [Pirellulaceae bacterium]